MSKPLTPPRTASAVTPQQEITVRHGPGCPARRLEVDDHRCTCGLMKLHATRRAVLEFLPKCPTCGGTRLHPVAAGFGIKRPCPTCTPLHEAMDGLGK